MINSNVTSAGRVTCRLISDVFYSDDLVASVSGESHPWGRSILSYSFPVHPASRHCSRGGDRPGMRQAPCRAPCAWKALYLPCGSLWFTGTHLCLELFPLNHGAGMDPPAALAVVGSILICEDLPESLTGSADF